MSRETKAGTGCGGCGSVVEGILESILGSSFRSKKSSEGICECTKYSRDDVIKIYGRKSPLRRRGDGNPRMGDGRVRKVQARS